VKALLFGFFDLFDVFDEKGRPDEKSYPSLRLDRTQRLPHRSKPAKIKKNKARGRSPLSTDKAKSGPSGGDPHHTMPTNMVVNGHFKKLGTTLYSLK
jgi:hypothetical protein